MSLSHFRDSINAKFQDKIDGAAQRAINMRVHANTRVDGYAMIQADTLAEARAFGEAMNIVTAEYKRMTETIQSVEKPQLEPTSKPGDNSIYG